MERMSCFRLCCSILSGLEQAPNLMPTSLKGTWKPYKLLGTPGKSLVRAMNVCKVETHVNRLQLRIAKAIKIGRYGRAKALQWLLTHSFYAKLLAIKKVTLNAGKYTAGIDGITWKTDRQKINAAHALKRTGYQAKFKVLILQ